MTVKFPDLPGRPAYQAPMRLEGEICGLEVVQGAVPDALCGTYYRVGADAAWHATFEQGWAHTPPDYVPNASVTFPEDPYGPDELLQDPPRLWPDTTTFPFHYRHPVTGKEITG